MVSRCYGELVIKYSLIPGEMGSEVTGVASGGKAGALVIGIGSTIIFLFMAAETIGRQIITCVMTAIAAQYTVRSFQSPELVMIKGGIGPGQGFGTMAGDTIGGEPGLLMIGVLD